MTAGANMKQAAVKLASEGFRVFPLIPGKKRPLIENWQERATSDAFTVLETWPGERCAPGICTDGLVVLDADAGKGGLEALVRLFGGTLPATRIVRTGGGGLHVYFLAPVGAEFSSRACVQRKNGTRYEAVPGYWGIDIRARGGLVVGPGSVLDGKTYTLEVNAPMMELPAFLPELLKPASAKSLNAGQVVAELDTPAALERATRYLTDEAPIALEGSGGDQLTYNVANRVLDFAIDPETALELMAEVWNERCEPPWDYDDLAKKVGNAAAYRQDAIGRDAPGRHFDVLVYPQGVEPDMSVLRLQRVPPPKLPMVFWSASLN